MLLRIRRENLTSSQLIENFEQGLDLDRLYYAGFAVFFYNGLGPHTAAKHLKKLNEGKFIDIINDKLYLTRKGLKSFYNAKFIFLLLFGLKPLLRSVLEYYL